MRKDKQTYTDPDIVTKVIKESSDVYRVFTECGINLVTAVSYEKAPEPKHISSMVIVDNWEG